MACLFLRERLEQTRPGVAVDTHAGVAHLKIQRAGAVAIEPQNDLAAIGELDRVIEQVGQRALQTVFVKAHSGVRLRDIESQLEPLLRGQQIEVIDLVLNERGERDRRRAERQSAGLQARVVENLLDSRQQGATGAPQRLGGSI